MRDLFANRLKNARKLAGMSQDELVSAMDGFVKKTSIAKYERAEMMPDSSVVLAISQALGLLPGYFLREFNVSIQKPEFRKKKKLSVKELASIEQKVMSSLEDYLELEELAGRADIFERPLMNLSIQNAEDVEIAAETLLHDWKLGLKGISNVFNVLEANGIRLIEIPTDESFDGTSTYANNQIPLIVCNKNYPVERKRLTVLHELGHLLLNFSKEISSDEKRKENLCFRFGAALLMPRDCVFKEIGKKRHELPLAELIIFKERYGLSVHAIIRRALELDIINESYYRSWHIKYNSNKKEEGWGHYPVIEKPGRFDQLMLRAIAEQVISVEKAAELVGLKSFDFIEKYKLNEF